MSNLKSFSRKFAFCFINTCVLSLASTAHAAMGGTSSGGGDALVTKFVATASSLLQQSIWTPSQKTLLENALNSAKVVSVSVLTDPGTGKPVANQNQLVAYGSPNLIQLKDASHIRPGDASFEELVKDKKPIAQYVAHELFRASGVVGTNGKSPDDAFQITIGQLHLDSSNPDVSMLKSGDYSAIGDTTLSASSTGGCYRHLEVNPTDATVVVQFREKNKGDCGGSTIPILAGYAGNYTCVSADALSSGLSFIKDGLPTYCVSQNYWSFPTPVTGFDDYQNHMRTEILEPLPDGNFLVKTLRTVPTDSNGIPEDQYDACGTTRETCGYASDYQESKFMPYSAQ